jgi:hypothetical protein
MSEGSFRPADVPARWGPPAPPLDGSSDWAPTAPEADADPAAARTDTTTVAADPSARSASGPARKAREAANAVGAEAKDEARHVAEAAKEEARQTAGVAVDKAKETVGEVTYQVREVYDHTRAAVVEQATTQQSRLAGALGSLSSEFGALADGTASPDGVATGLVRDASRYVGGVADWLGSRSLDEVLDEVSSYARHHPGRFLLIAAAAGLVAGRVVRGMKDASPTPPPSTAPLVTRAGDDGVARPVLGPDDVPASSEPVEEGAILPPPRLDAPQPGGLPATRFS